MPAVKVKCYHFGPDLSVIMERFKCSEEIAQRALNWAWESACQQFWESFNPGWYNDLEEYYFPGTGASIVQEGRSGGWAAVDGLKALEDWDAVDLARWRKFENSLTREVASTAKDFESILGDMESNRWCEPDAEQYNFCDTRDGKTFCVADVERVRREAGDAAVKAYIDALPGKVSA